MALVGDFVAVHHDFLRLGGGVTHDLHGKRKRGFGRAEGSGKLFLSGYSFKIKDYFLIVRTPVAIRVRLPIKLLPVVRLLPLLTTGCKRSGRATLASSIPTAST
jgi:hypothetical protein